MEVIFVWLIFCFFLMQYEWNGKPVSEITLQKRCLTWMQDEFCNKLRPIQPTFTIYQAESSVAQLPSFNPDTKRGLFSGLMPRPHARAELLNSHAGVLMQAAESSSKHHAGSSCSMASDGVSKHMRNLTLAGFTAHRWSTIVCLKAPRWPFNVSSSWVSY